MVAARNYFQGFYLSGKRRLGDSRVSGENIVG
jgi:hypothetical protein